MKQTALADRAAVKRCAHLDDQSNQSEWTPAAPPKPTAGRQCYALMRAVQRAHARKALSGSSLPHASHGSSSLSRSIPWPGQATSWVNSQSHKPRRRNRAPRPEWIWQNASTLLNRCGFKRSNTTTLFGARRSCNGCCATLSFTSPTPGHFLQ